MVASIQHQMLYYMDPYFEAQNVPHRQGRIKDLVTLLFNSNYVVPH